MTKRKLAGWVEMIYLSVDCRALMLALGFVFLVSSNASANGDEQEAAKGLAILQKNCARCHALGLTDNSPHAQAPPFRDIVHRYPVEDLEESLAEGIMSGHPDMPEFSFDPDQIGWIIAYLNSLKAKEKR